MTSFDPILKETVFGLVTKQFTLAKCRNSYIFVAIQEPSQFTCHKDVIYKLEKKSNCNDVIVVNRWRNSILWKSSRRKKPPRKSTYNKSRFFFFLFEKNKGNLEKVQRPEMTTCNVWCARTRSRISLQQSDWVSHPDSCIDWRAQT